MKIVSPFFCSLLAFLFASLSPLHAEPAQESLENISVENYCAFLNAVETTDAHGFYHPEMGSDPTAKCISQTLAEDGVHFTYSIIGDCAELSVPFITQSDAICFFNWLQHGCPTGNAVTDEDLYTPLAPTTHDAPASFCIGTSTSTPNQTDVPTTLPSAQQNEKPHTSSYSSYFYNGLKAVGGALEWTAWNVGGEVVEAVVFQQCGLYALGPYCLYMGAVILHEYENGEYWAAAGTILHALFDIACMLGNRIGFDVAGILGNALEKCGLKCVADFFASIHGQIDSLMHALGIEHSHGVAVEDGASAAPFRQKIAGQLAGSVKCKGCTNPNCTPSFDLNEAYWRQFDE